MKIEPKPSDREVLAGLVERVTYQNAENGFCVIWVKLRCHRVTLVGHAAVICRRVNYGDRELDQRPHPLPPVQSLLPQDLRRTARGPAQTRSA